MTLPQADWEKTDYIYWAICLDCEWSGADQPSEELASAEASTHSLVYRHDTDVNWEENYGIRFPEARK